MPLSLYSHYVIHSNPYAIKQTENKNVDTELQKENIKVASLFLIILLFGCLLLWSCIGSIHQTVKFLRLPQHNLNLEVKEKQSNSSNNEKD